jgi:hypothetical protein
VSPDRIHLGNLYADILVDRRHGAAEVWHYILQREGSPEILFWGNVPSRDEAIRLATDLLHQYRAHAVSSAAG